MLHLVLADRHDVRTIDEDVRRHEDGIEEQADAGVDALVDLLLVRHGAFEQAHVGDSGQYPCQLGHFGHVGLAEEDGLVGIESEGEVIEGDIADVFAQRRGPVRRLDFVAIETPAGRFIEGSQGVVIGDEVEARRIVLQGDVLADGAEVVAEVELAGRLHAAEDAPRAGGRVSHIEDP